MKITQDYLYLNTNRFGPNSNLESRLFKTGRLLGVDMWPLRTISSPLVTLLIKLQSEYYCTFMEDLVRQSTFIPLLVRSCKCYLMCEY